MPASQPQDRQRQHREPRKATTVGRILPTDSRPGREQLVHERKHFPAPVSISVRQLRPSGEVIVPPDVKRTIAPVRPGRFEPTGPIVGGFATMRPGQYLPETGFSGYVGGEPSRPTPPEESKKVRLDGWQQRLAATSTHLKDPLRCDTAFYNAIDASGNSVTRKTEIDAGI